MFLYWKVSVTGVFEIADAAAFSFQTPSKKQFMQRSGLMSVFARFQFKFYFMLLQHLEVSLFLF